MQTRLPAEFLATEAGRRADAVLRSCVHCGFCLATCPSYQVLGNELDSPRGRIYLIKNMLEGEEAGEHTRTHLDRCLSCQACETTCPSGVNYHELLEIGRAEVERQAPRPAWQRWLRRALVGLMSNRHLFTPASRLGSWLRPLAPSSLQHYLPLRRAGFVAPINAYQRQVILVQGCVQPGLSPQTNQAAALVLGRLGIRAMTVSQEKCCGALAMHLNEQERALAQARSNVDAWWPLLQAGAEAVVMTASGCSNQVQEYARLLAAEPAYAERAQVVVDKLSDISQLLVNEDLERLPLRARPDISWHCPCTAQHGQQFDGSVREVLSRLGFKLPQITDAHLCCGSAGTYSLFNPEIARTLRERKLTALQRSKPEQIVTANIGCQVHLSGGTRTPVVHWIELVAQNLQAPAETSNS